MLNTSRQILSDDQAAGSAKNEFDFITQAFATIEAQRKVAEEKSHQTLCELSGNLLKLGEGAPATEAVTASDEDAKAVSTAYREAAKKVNQVRARLTATTRILQELPSAVIAVDDNGLIRFVNVAAEKILGRSGSSLTKREFKTLLGTPTDAHDPFARVVLSPLAFNTWLKSGGKGEAVIEITRSPDTNARIALSGMRLSNSVDGVWYFAARELNEEYSRVSIDRAETREKSLRAVWDSTARAGTESIDAILASARLLTSDAKQTGSDRDAMLNRVNSVRQHAGGLEAYIRTVRWLSQSLWGELPQPLITEFQALEPVKAAIDQLTPRFKSRNINVTVNDAGGWVVADDEWIRTAMLGVLSHAVDVVADSTVGVHLKRLAPLPDATEERVAFEILDAGPLLTAAQMADLESPFGGINTPNFLNPENEGFMPGLILAAELARNMGGTIEFDATPGGGLVVRFIVPTRVANGVSAEPATEPMEMDVLEELVLGWKLGVA
ncbi:hypothetical protein BH11PLA2_BH11PLA2_23990 [soil metagenome]